jgi:hypothetical protein
MPLEKLHIPQLPPVYSLEEPMQCVASNARGWYLHGVVTTDCRKLKITRFVVASNGLTS